jgi:putative membrane protein
MAVLIEAERQQVEAAITAAERGTQGEIVVVVARSVFLARWPDLVIAAAGTFVLSGVLLLVQPATSAVALYGTQLVLFLLLLLVSCVPGLWERLLPGGLRSRAVRRFAAEQFVELGLHRTVGRTGVLIVVALAEHRVEVLVDDGVAEVVEPSAWQRPVEDFVAKIRRGRLVEGLVAAVQDVGAILAEHLPGQPGDRNELANRVVET